MAVNSRLTNKLAQSATNKKTLRQPSLRFAAMTGRNCRRTAARTRAFHKRRWLSLGSARVSRVWFRRRAETIFAETRVAVRAFANRQSSRSRGRARQHARRVRYPDHKRFTRATTSSSIRAASLCPAPKVGCRRCALCCRFLFRSCRRENKVASARRLARLAAVAAL